MTTANIVFTLSDFDQYTEDDIYHIFGTPEKESPRLISGDTPGDAPEDAPEDTPEIPRYIVKALDVLSSKENIINKDVRIIDFDQSFPITSPPEKLLGTSNRMACSRGSSGPKS
jgi:serine/threonine-protein kinase SRPK3